jgi:hypothetical protein
MDMERYVFYGYEIVVYGLLFESGVRHGEGQSIVGVRVGRLQEKILLKESPAGNVSCYSGRDRRQLIIGASKWQFSDRLYTEVLF